MKKFRFYFAIIGWVFAFTLHLFSLADVNYHFPAQFVSAWLLNIGLFIVWFPVLINIKNEEPEVLSEPVQTSDLYKNTPTWMKILVAICIPYAAINFALIFPNHSGLPAISNGQYVLIYHKEVIKTLTLREYQHYQANEIKALTGHLLFFYGLAVAAYYPFGKQE
jgi:hypothetical protein